MSKSRFDTWSYKTRRFTDRLNAATQTLGTASVAGTLFVSYSDVMRVTGIPILAMIQGLVTMANGVSTFLDNENPQANWNYTYERRLKSFAQVLSGSFLLEGGIESYRPIGNSLSSVNLLWRFAINSLTDFLLACNQLAGSYRISKSAQNDTDVVQRRREIYWTMLGTALSCAAWTILALTGDITNSYGLTCMLASTIPYGIRDTPRIASSIRYRCEYWFDSKFDFSDGSFNSNNASQNRIISSRTR